MNTRLIVNPNASTIGDEPAASVMHRLAERPGVTVHRTAETGDARRFAAEAVDAGADLVIAAGGDGTISEVVNGLARGLDRTRLAIVPAGTANDFATTLGLVQDDPDAILAVIDRGVERRVDLIHSATDNSSDGGDASSRLIINACTGGFSEVVHDKLTPDVKRGWGPLAYLRAAVDAMPEICWHDTAITIDGETIHASTCSVVIANGRSAGGLELDPAARVDDGRIDVIIITAQTFLDEMRLATRFLAGDHLRSDHLIFRRGREVRLDADPPMHFSSDGELIGPTPIGFTIRPAALRVLTPG